MHRFTKEDFEGTGTQFSIGDIKLRVWLGEDGKYCCTASFTQSLTTVTCRSECKHFKDAIRNAIGKLAWSLIEYDYIVGITDKEGGEWFTKAFMGEHSL